MTQDANDEDPAPASVVPGFLLDWVTSFLAEDNPDLLPIQETLAQIIQHRFETQFDPKLMGFLTEAAKSFGPFGVALAAASLVPWPAMAERLLPAQPLDPGVSARTAQVAVGNVRRSMQVELAQALGTHEDSAWNWMLDLVREHAKKMQSIRMAGISLQNLQIKPFSFTQTSGLMMSQSGGERCLDTRR